MPDSRASSVISANGASSQPGWTRGSAPVFMKSMLSSLFSACLCACACACLCVCTPISLCACGFTVCVCWGGGRGVPVSAYKYSAASKQ